MKLIGLSGYAQSGKDTVAGILKDHGYQRVSFADTLRSCLYAINPIVSADGSELGWEWPIKAARLQEVVDELGWDRAKVELPEVRQLLQRLGTEAGRKILGENVWVEAAFAVLDPAGYYVFTDCRFPNEASAVVQEGGLVWRINRPGTAPVNAHPSETAIDDWPFDAHIINNGTLASLRETVEKVLRAQA